MAQVAYAPAQVSAHVGDSVEWTNDDIVAHTATARNGAWDVMVGPNSKGSITLKSPGTIEYYCRLQPNMVGSNNSFSMRPGTNTKTAGAARSPKRALPALGRMPQSPQP